MINSSNPASAIQPIINSEKMNIELSRAINSKTDFSSNNSSPKGMLGFDQLNYDEENEAVFTIREPGNKYLFCFLIQKIKFVKYVSFLEFLMLVLNIYKCVRYALE